MERMNKQLFLSLCFSLISILGLAQTNNLGEQLKQTISGKAATVGVAVIFNGKELVTVNNIYRFPLANSIQFHQALAVTDYINKQDKTLNEELTIKKSQLFKGTHSPMRDNNPNGNFIITIRDIIKYSLLDGDNNASDILFDYIGGPEKVEKYVHDLGIKDISITQTEANILKNPENIMLNWSKPSAATLLLETFLQQPVCSKGQKTFLQRTMVDSKAGNNKLKAGLPKNVLLAHIASSTKRNEYGYKIADNDMGFVVLPNGQYYTIAVFIMNSRESDKGNAKIIADISKVVYEYFVKNYQK